VVGQDCELFPNVRDSAKRCGTGQPGSNHVGRWSVADGFWLSLDGASTRRSLRIESSLLRMTWRSARASASSRQFAGTIRRAREQIDNLVQIAHTPSLGRALHYGPVSRRRGVVTLGFGCHAGAGSAARFATHVQPWGWARCWAPCLGAMTMSNQADRDGPAGIPHRQFLREQRDAAPWPEFWALRGAQAQEQVEELRKSLLPKS